MDELMIFRELDGVNIQVLLSDTELEKAYRIIEARYLDEDFNNRIIDDEDCPVTLAVLNDAPEIILWLIIRFQDIYDSNVSHNDLIAQCIECLKDEIKTPFFYKKLQNLANPICLGYWKNGWDCEEHCIKYYRCSNIASANDRRKRYETAYHLLLSHKQEKCSCSADSTMICAAGKLFNNEYDFSAFLLDEPEGKV